MDYKGLELDSFQEKAILAIEENKSVIVSAPTGSGKTLIADYIIERDFRKGLRVIYTAPIKALSNQKYREFSAEYGAGNVGLITGDISRNADAKILVMTTEIYRNMVLSEESMISDISYVIFDEIHYINDMERGTVWEESIIFSKPHIRMLCLSATIPNAEQFGKWIETIKGHKVEVVSHEERPVPLHVHFYDSELGIVDFRELNADLNFPDYHHITRGPRQRTPKSVNPSHTKLIKEISQNLPGIFFSFSRAAAQKMAQELARQNLFDLNPEITRFVRKKLEDSPPEINTLQTTAALRQVLPYGIAFHHAGLIPVMKEVVEELFSMGLIRVLYATETFAVGVNMPAKSVCLESLSKFDGISFRMMNSKEYFQMAGRAGRRGLDKEGHVYIMVDRQKFQPDRARLLMQKDTEPIMSQFRLSVNTVLNLVRKHNATEIDEILSKNFDSYQKYGADLHKRKNYKSHNSYENLKKQLEKNGYVKSGMLTGKGEFASRIYSDEIITTEIFGTGIIRELNQYQALLLLACICHEKEKTEFHRQYQSKDLERVKRLVLSHNELRQDKRFREMGNMTSIMHPCYHGKSIFEIIPNTSMPEGDLIRFLKQVIDRTNQIRHAAPGSSLAGFMDGCRQIVVKCIQDVDMV